MLFKATVLKKIEKDIELPYYSYNKATGEFFRINENGSVICIYCGVAYSSMQISKQENDGVLARALEADSCEEFQFEDALRGYLEFSDSTLKKYWDSIDSVPDKLQPV